MKNERMAQYHAVAYLDGKEFENTGTLAELTAWTDKIMKDKQVK